jgi:cob(I)alamin adenosyltransferase
MAKVTTGTGDDGFTGLLGAERVAKYAPIPELLGAVDEATSALGLARALTTDAEVRALLLHVQRALYTLMAEVATPPENQAAVGYHTTPEAVAWLETAEADLKERVTIPNRFVIPGDTTDGAALDVARTVIRRAERLAVRLWHEGTLTNPEIVRYLNRCSDFAFILARVVEVRAGGSTLATENPEGS